MKAKYLRYNFVIQIKQKTRKEFQLRNCNIIKCCEKNSERKDKSMKIIIFQDERLIHIRRNNNTRNG